MRLVAALEQDASPPDDAELLSRARGGDGGAFRQLFLRHAPAVRRLLGGLFREAHAADEATQETFVRAYSALASLRDSARLRGWILGIARIVWLDEAARHRRELRLPSLVFRDGEALAPSAEACYLDAEASGALGAALRRLCPQRQVALLMRLDQGLSYGEIADALQWPLHKVRNEIHRGRLEIRDQLLAYLEGTPP